jgi:restriction system protein
MARRRREDAIDQWIALPWQAAAAAGAICFVLLHWIAPAILGGAVGRALAPVFGLLGWMALFVFGLIAAASYVRASRESGAYSFRRIEPSAPHAHPAPSPVPTADLGANWPRPTSVAQAEVPRPSVWALDVLQRMDWKRFEFLAAAYYERIGFRTEPIRWGADEGVDVKLFRGDLSEPVSVVQCKAWNGRPVGVSEVRELLGVMTDSEVKTGVFLTTSTFTDAAVKFAEGNKIALVDGAQFLERVLALPPEAQSELLAVACEGDWTTPSCPSCAVKLVHREGKRGSFWGCRNFPRCRYTRPKSTASK